MSTQRVAQRMSTQRMSMQRAAQRIDMQRGVQVARGAAPGGAQEHHGSAQDQLDGVEL
jgi:hypothetical protein